MRRSHLSCALLVVGLLAASVQPALWGPAMARAAAGTLTWSGAPVLPTPRFALGVATAANARIYAVGGTNIQGANFNVTQELDPVSGVWSPRTSMPTGRFSLALVAASDGKLYAIGGASTSGTFRVLNTVEAYTPATDTWAARASMPTARFEFGVAADKD